MEPLWTAQPGEWYEVRQEEGGWALAIYEYDTPDWQVWIQEDSRVQVLDTTHTPVTTTFLVIDQPTQAYSVTMDPLWVAQPGEMYEVRETDADWVLGIWEHDSPDWQVWIQIGPGVHFQTLP
jgi:hypothetical protein